MFMLNKHQSTSLQLLGHQGRELRLTSVVRLRMKAAGWLEVAAGDVWLTRDGSLEDHMLGAGDRLWLGRGEVAVVEPLRQGQVARLDWRQAAPVAQSPLPLSPRPFKVWRRLAQGFLAAARWADGRFGAARPVSTMGACEASPKS